MPARAAGRRGRAGARAARVYTTVLGTGKIDQKRCMQRTDEPTAFPIPLCISYLRIHHP